MKSQKVSPVPLTHRRQSQLETLYEITTLLNAPMESDRLLRRVLEITVRGMRASGGSLLLMEEEAKCLRYHARTGPKIDPPRHGILLGQGVVGRAALLGKPVRVEASPGQARSIQAGGSGHGELAAPLLLADKVFGVICVDYAHPHESAPEDREMLMALCSQASKVIQNARLHDQYKQRAEELETLFTVGQTIVSSLDLKEVLERIVREAVRLTKTRLCSLMLLDETGSELAIRAVFGSSQQYLRKPNLKVFDSLLGQVVVSKRPLCVLDVKKEPRYKFHFLAAREGLCSLLSVPLLYEGSPIGVLNVYTDRPHLFQKEEVNILLALASLSAIAIEKARLYEKVMMAEEYVRRNEKLSLLGGIAAEVAHEIRNPMTVINMLIHSMERDMDPDDHKRRDVEIIRRKLAQANQMVTQLLDVTRSREPHFEPVDANALLEELLTVMRHRLALKNIRVVTRFAESLPPLRADHLRLEQAFLNLIFNATEAMPEGGVLTIRTQQLHAQGAEARRLAVSIRDTGVGISPEQLKRLFEPFFTLRPMGVGLGLAMVQRVVKDHNGSIRIKSRHGKGSQFVVEFPLP